MPNNDKLLIKYVKKDDIKKVTELIEAGADVNCNNGMPLQTCCELDFYKMAKLLLDNEADVNLHEEDGKSLLHHACVNSKHKFVRLFLKKGAELGDENDQKEYIKLCITNDDDKTLALLIKYGLDFDDQVQSVMDKCIKQMKQNVAEYIFNNYPNIDTKNIHSMIKEDDISTYQFVKILADHNLIDVDN